MIICIDTNVLVQARARTHAYHPILDAWVNGRYQLAVSTAILLEYEEVMTRLSGKTSWLKFSRLMDLVELTNAGVIRITPSYQFHVITEDRDDNQFCDCAIAANADYLITEDRHFAPLANAGYKPQPIKPQEFLNRHPYNP